MTAKEITQQTRQALEEKLDFQGQWALFVTLGNLEFLTPAQSRRYNKAVDWLVKYLGCDEDFLLEQEWDSDTSEADVRNIWEESKELYKETE